MSNEANVSTNIFLHSQKGASIQLTVRNGATKEEVASTLDVLAFGIGYAAEKYNLSASKHVTVQNVPQLQGNAPGIAGNLSFQTELLEMTMNRGKTYWKIKGHPFMNYGVTIWPEVLEAAGYNVEQLQAEVSQADNWQIEFKGYTATYAEKTKDGKTFPDKVTSLEGERIQPQEPAKLVQQAAMPEEPPF